MNIIRTKGKYGIFADRDNPELDNPKREISRRARAALPILVYVAQQRSTITYKELADAIAARDMLNHTMDPILDCIEVEIRKLSNHHSWVHKKIPNLTAVVVEEEGNELIGWMPKQMREQMEMEPNWDDYTRYLLKPVHEYEYWRQVIGDIIWIPDW